MELKHSRLPSPDRRKGSSATANSPGASFFPLLPGGNIYMSGGSPAAPRSDRIAASVGARLGDFGLGRPIVTSFSRPNARESRGAMDEAIAPPTQAGHNRPRNPGAPLDAS